LSIGEKLEIVESLWDQIAESPEALPIPDWHKDELDRRSESFESDPGAGIPWDEAKRRIRSSDV
jgi:putative addiction module component (TIGR02574 family)